MRPPLDQVAWRPAPALWGCAKTSVDVQRTFRGNLTQCFGGNLAPFKQIHYWRMRSNARTGCQHTLPLRAAPSAASCCFFVLAFIGGNGFVTISGHLPYFNQTTARKS